MYKILLKQFIVFIFLCFFVMSLYATNNSGVKLQKQSTINQKDTFLVLKQDTLYLMLTQSKESVIGFDWQKNMPWIGAVIIGILTVIANILISLFARKSNREVTEKQLNNAKEIALAQIENASKNVQLEINKTVLSGNRQVWINDLRELISKILSNTMAISVKQNLTNDEFGNLRFLITKTELMLNATKDADFILALVELENCCLDILMGNKNVSELRNYSDKVKQYTQTTLKTEWERVKKGE